MVAIIGPPESLLHVSQWQMDDDIGGPPEVSMAMLTAPQKHDADTVEAAAPSPDIATSRRGARIDAVDSSEATDARASIYAHNSRASVRERARGR
eukprot:4465372-Prymnesium_polylepis.1